MQETFWKDIQAGKVFAPFSLKNFDKYKDELHETWAFYGLTFPRYDNLDFPLPTLFPLRNFARVANYKQNFKKLAHVHNSQ